MREERVRAVHWWFLVHTNWAGDDGPLASFGSWYQVAYMDAEHREKDNSDFTVGDSNFRL